MRPPCEIVVRYVLPRLRAKIAEKLIEVHGMSKKQVAEILNVSQASISKYKRILREKIPFETRSIDAAAEEIADLILEGEDPKRIMLKICSLCFSLRTEGVLCKFHREYPGLEGCEICSKYFQISKEISEEETVLADLREALRKILDVPEFSKLIPEVRSNLVVAKKGAKNVEEIAGIPGRITVIGGRPHASSGPSFGASKHTAAILLEAMNYSNYRALMCIKYNEDVLNAIKSLGYKYKEISREKGDLSDFFSSFSSWKKVPEIVIDPGRKGIEPIVYIFGKNATEVVNKALRILSRLS